jgi:hypothetical protein
LRGSQTTNNQADAANAERASGGLLMAAQNAGNFQLGNAVAQIFATLGPIAKGQTAATKALIAKALMSNDPMAVLTPALRNAAVNQTQRRVIESAVRNAVRPALD